MNFAIEFMNAIVSIRESAGMNNASSESDPMCRSMGMNSAIETAFSSPSDTMRERAVPIAWPPG